MKITENKLFGFITKCAQFGITDPQLIANLYKKAEHGAICPACGEKIECPCPMHAGEGAAMGDMAGAEAVPEAGLEGLLGGGEEEGAGGLAELLGGLGGGAEEAPEEAPMMEEGAPAEEVEEPTEEVEETEEETEEEETEEEETEEEE